MMPEAYPTSVRNTGVSWCQAFARFGGAASGIVLGGLAGMTMFMNAQGGTNWSMLVLVLIIPFVLGFICCVWFGKETVGKTMDQLAEEEAKLANPDTDGNGRFIGMLVVIAILFVLCIICPIAVAGWSKLPAALPLMAVGVLLPFLYFFIFAGAQVAKDKKKA